jgi:hypothetical protein
MQCLLLIVSSMPGKDNRIRPLPGAPIRNSDSICENPIAVKHWTSRAARDSPREKYAVYDGRADTSRVLDGWSRRPRRQPAAMRSLGYRRSDCALMQDVRFRVEENITLFSSCRGYIVSSGHNIQANTPTENVVALFETVRRTGL